MISVERIEGFRDLPSEAAFTNDYDDQISHDWPQNGSIDVQDLSVRYRDGLPLSLRNLSFKIDGGCRVGKSICMSSIVGLFLLSRTAALTFYSSTYILISRNCWQDWLW